MTTPSSPPAWALHYKGGSALRQQAGGLISQPCDEPLLLSHPVFHSCYCGVLLLRLALAVHSGLAVTVTWHALAGSCNLTSTWQEGRDCLCNTHSLRLAPLDPRSPSQPRSYNLLISFWHLSRSLSFTGQDVSRRPMIFFSSPSAAHVFPPTLMPSCDVKSRICVQCSAWAFVFFCFFSPPRFPRGSDWPFSPSESPRLLLLLRSLFLPSPRPPAFLSLHSFWHAMFLHCTSVTCDLVTHSPGFTPTWLRRQSPCSTCTEETAAVSGKQRRSADSSGWTLWWKPPLTTVLKINPEKSPWDHDFRFCQGYLWAYFTDFIWSLLFSIQNRLCFLIAALLLKSLFWPKVTEQPDTSTVCSAIDSRQ